MQLVLPSLALVLVASLVSAGPLASQSSHGSSDANILFDSRRRGEGVGTSSQAGETSATSVQNTNPDGQQTNRNEAGAASAQSQTGLGGATQTTINQGAAQALQGAGTASGSGGGGGGSGQQVSNNQVNIVSDQHQQNVEGTLINVQGGSEGVVVVNKRKPGVGRAIGPVVTQQQTSSGNELLKIMDNNEIVLVITAEKSEEIVEPEIPAAPSCRYFCRRPTNNEPYCCDDGTNRRGEPTIHGGQCPRLRLLCIRFSLFNKCAHDGQCPPSDKCCFDACLDMHICKRADAI